jgi:signal transduction histidine kinase
MAKEEITYLIIFGTLVFLILLLFVVGFIISFYKKNRAYQKHLLAIQYEKEQEVLKSQLEIREQTFKNISQEIHDNIGQVLSLAKLTVSNINLAESDGNREKIMEVKLLISKAIQDLRDLSKILNTDYIVQKGLAGSIEYEVSVLRKLGVHNASLNTHGEVFKINDQTELILYRIFQELINNIIKHSAATDIQIDLFFSPHDFTMIVRDNGQGFNIENLNELSENGLGIQNIRKRAKLIGANSSIETAPGKGTKVQIQLPLSSDTVA